jgi:short-subunit dehydrogenase
MTSPYRTALVTGASSGIGRALAERLAADGVTVVLSARRESLLRGVADAITARGGKARVEPLDVADTSRTVEAIRRIDGEVGGLDLVIANAGVGMRPRDTPSFSWEAVAAPCHVNFCGAVATVTAVLPAMAERRRGHAVGISSLAAFGALPGRGGYSAPKAGLSMFLDGLRMDLAPYGVHVTAVHPGFVRTAMTARTRAPMPFIMESAAAADLIVRALAKAPATIDFPLPLTLAARLGGVLPRLLRDPLLRRLTPDARRRTPGEGT